MHYLEKKWKMYLIMETFKIAKSTKRTLELNSKIHFHNREKISDDVLLYYILY